MSDPPAAAACRHVDVREGFEVLFLRREHDGYRFEGHATGLEEGEAWGIRYELVLDSGWTTRSAHVVGRSCSGAHEVRLEADGAGGWTIDGAPAPELAGCLDVDLEASAFTNTLPVNRLRLGVGERAEAPAAYVRAVDLRVERLEQRYARVEDDGAGSRYDYEAPDLQFACRIVYDRFGLVLDYPGIAVRVM
ncbi:MAG: putative glycolipid-binding domain-containing protein [Gaiellaceae bacterium]